MAGREPRVVRFGNFELDQRTGELRKHGLKIKLQKKPLQVLNLLLERHGAVVSREELQRSLWPDGVFVDFDHSLNTAIKKLRDALGDTATASRYIATIDRLGYRFAVPVIEVAAVSGTSPYGAAAAPAPAPESEGRTFASDAPPITADMSSAITSAHWRPWARIGLVLVLLIVGLTLAFLRSRWRARPSSDSERTMLAVLPFENLTGDSSQDYFSDGLTEEMISQLGQLDPQHLGVIARTSVMHYKKTQQPLDQIGRELGVNYVLEGSVRRDSANVRISAQLIQLKDQTHLWARQYDRQISSLLALQTEIAQEVADEIQLTLGEKTRPATTSASASLSPQAVEAYDLYLRGRYFWNKRTKDGLEQAAESFRQAIAKDPAYAPAYAGLADTYAIMNSYGYGAPISLMPQARAAALKALQLDDKLAESHTSLALVTENYDYDWQTAEKEFHRAIELNPNYATAHHWYAECLMWLGRFDEALAESERARQLDPLSLIIAADRGAILYYEHKYDLAIEQLRAVLAIDPHFSRANVIYTIYLRQGRFSEALANSDKDLSHCAADPWVCGWLVYAYALSDQLAQAQPYMRELERLDRTRPIRPEPLVCAHIALGHTEEALRYLEKEYSERNNYLTGLKVDPIYDPLRSDPRFQELLRKVGLAQ